MRSVQQPCLLAFYACTPGVFLCTLSLLGVLNRWLSLCMLRASTAYADAERSAVIGGLLPALDLPTPCIPLVMFLFSAQLTHSCC
jgi:hypothetical protein